jgi:hypothetical protein
VVSSCLIPSRVQVLVHTAEVNWVPLSVVMVPGKPKHATQLAMKTSVQVLASMLRSGNASTHLVDLSMAVNRYTRPSEEAGRGPTRSTCTLENLRAGMGMAWSGADGCLWTFPPWHYWQSLHMAAMSLAMPSQTKCADTMRLVACMPGWATL